MLNVIHFFFLRFRYYIPGIFYCFGLYTSINFCFACFFLRFRYVILLDYFGSCSVCCLTQRCDSDRASPPLEQLKSDPRGHSSPNCMLQVSMLQFCFHFSGSRRRFLVMRTIIELKECVGVFYVFFKYLFVILHSLMYYLHDVLCGTTSTNLFLLETLCFLHKTYPPPPVLSRPSKHKQNACTR